MRAQRAGRFSGSSEPKKAKPLPPLRERINPALKGFETLDDQQRELEWEYSRKGSTMDAEEYFSLLQCIETKREALSKRDEAARGIPRAKPVKDTPVVVKASRTHHRPSYPMPTRWASWLVFILVIGFLFMQKH